MAAKPSVRLVAKIVVGLVLIGAAWTLIASHLSRPAAVRFWETLRDARIPVLPLEATDIEAAWYIAQGFPDQDFSFTDCTSFALMERLGVTEAFAFDRHFLVYRYGANRQRAFRRRPS